MAEMDRKIYLLNAYRLLAAIQRLWKVGVTFFAISVVGICLLLFPNSHTWAIYKPLLFLTVVAIVLTAVWLQSYVVAPILSHRLERLRKQNLQQDATATKKKAKRGSTRMLNVFQRLAAHRKLMELRKTSDYCFLGNHDSYLRIQRDADELLVKLSGESITLDVTSPDDVQDADETCKLVVENGVNNRGHRWVTVRLESSDPHLDMTAAQGVRLLPDDPVALAYGTWNTAEDGSEEPNEAICCVITWVGGVL